MTKSIVSGGVVLVAVVVIVLGLIGVYDLSDSGLLSWGAVGMIATILFASFGGFKPFFAAPTQKSVTRTAGDGGRAPDLTEANEVASEGTARGPRRLISVGADGAEADTVSRRPLFEDRPPLTKPLEPSSETSPDGGDRPPRHTLFGEALGERLAEERPTADAPGDAGRDEIEPDETRTDHTAEDETVIEDAEDGSDSTTGPGERIVVDENPVWVSTDDGAPVEPSAHVEVDTGQPVDAGESASEPHADAPVQTGDEQETPEALADTPVETSEDEQQTPEPLGEAPVQTGEAGSDADDEVSAELPVALAAPPAIELHSYSSEEVMAIVKAQESDLVETLISEGLLTTQGPITDRDVRTMVFVAVSSKELIEVLTTPNGSAIDGGRVGPAALEGHREPS